VCASTEEDSMQIGKEQEVVEVVPNETEAPAPYEAEPEREVVTPEPEREKVKIPT